MAEFSPNALQLIYRFEGLNQPGRWPGGGSGITLGIGYDLGYATLDQFVSDWEKFLANDAFANLKSAIGLTGIKAKNRAPDYAAIRIKLADAKAVFESRSLPLAVLRTGQAFPGLERLPPDAQGALVSLVYNRGAAMVDPPGSDRRREMRAIRDAVARKDLPEIANQLRLMKRLWQGKGLDGLIKRREAEAVLVENTLRQP